MTEVLTDSMNGTSLNRYIGHLIPNGGVLHTYIIGPYNSSVRIIDIVSYTAYVVCVNFIHNCGIYSLKSTPNDIFLLRNFSWEFYLLSEKSARNLLRGNR